MRRPRLPFPGSASAAFFMGVAVLFTSGCSAQAPAPDVRAAPETPAAATVAPAASSVPVPTRPRVIGPGSSQRLPVEAAPAGSSPKAVAHADALARVESLIGEPRCTSDTQCHTVAMGARACGGPLGYRAWSGLVTDGAALKVASARERELALEVEREAARMSPCLFLADPGAQCRAGRCETRGVSPMPAAR